MPQRLRRPGERLDGHLDIYCAPSVRTGRRTPERRERIATLTLGGNSSAVIPELAGIQLATVAIAPVIIHADTVLDVFDRRDFGT
jgi:hypothetical protein